MDKSKIDIAKLYGWISEHYPDDKDYDGACDYDRAVLNGKQQILDELAKFIIKVRESYDA